MVKNNKTDVPYRMKVVFGVFMLLIYFGMGVLMFTDFFSWMPQWTRIFVGVLFIGYGFWRAYRQIRIVRVDKEEEEDNDEKKY